MSTTPFSPWTHASRATWAVAAIAIATMGVSIAAAVRQIPRYPPINGAAGWNAAVAGATAILALLFRQTASRRAAKPNHNTRLGSAYAFLGSVILAWLTALVAIVVGYALLRVRLNQIANGRGSLRRLLRRQGRRGGNNGEDNEEDEEWEGHEDSDGARMVEQPRNATGLAIACMALDLVELIFLAALVNQMRLAARAATNNPFLTTSKEQPAPPLPPSSAGNPNPNGDGTPYGLTNAGPHAAAAAQANKPIYAHHAHDPPPAYSPPPLEQQETGEIQGPSSSSAAEAATRQWRDEDMVFDGRQPGEPVPLHPHEAVGKS